jgi:hypothetical protein
MPSAQIVQTCQLVYDGTEELQLIDVQLREIHGLFERVTHLIFEVGDWQNVSFREYSDGIEVDL